METRAPAVVAVVVTTDPDGLFEETLRSLRDQDYAEMSILVLSNRGGPDVARRVGHVAPGTFVAQLDEDRGFGAAINHALEMVQGAQYLLLCHDDVILDPDAVHLLVEESFRSNAGIVTPKVVSIDDRSVLLHVGQSVDRYGTVIERVQPGEIDQGQHDAVRDVFVAPGGVTLIRDDLLRQLGGFDERYLAMGDDLELCWRAQIAGARIVCAPQAVIAHKERLASGDRVLLTPPGELAPPTLSRLVRRNELRTLSICWGRFERAFTLFVLAILHLAEIVIAVIGGDAERAVDIREAWRTRWRERKDVRASRHRVRALRSVSDRSIRSLQSSGATRLQTFLTTLFHQGFDVATGVLEPVAEPDDDAPVLTASFGGAFSDDEGFDELDDLGRRQRPTRGRRRFASPRALLSMGVVAGIVYVIGSRDLIGTHLPLLGQLVPLGSWTSTWHSVFASWQPAGLGSGAPGHTGYAALGLLGTLTVGQMGVAVRLLLLVAAPVGAWGASRLAGPDSSGRARLLAAFAFLGLTLWTDAVAGGRMSDLVAIGAMPFIVRRVLRLCQVPPFDEEFAPRVAIGANGWRRSMVGQVASLAFLLAIVGALSPAVLVVTEIIALGIAAAGAVMERHGALRGQLRVLAAVLAALVLLLPLTLPALLAGGSGLSIFGERLAPWSTPGLGGLIRMDIGPVGGGVLSWLLPIAALVPLFIARGRRLGLAARLAMVGILSLALALFVSRDWLGVFSPDLFVVLAPLATAMAVMVGLGLSAFEEDLHDYHFGWRQAVGILGVAAALIGLAPFVVAAGGGRWKMPTTGYNDALGFLGAPAQQGYRVLWLGDPRAIPGASWSIEPGLAWSTSTGGLPGESNLFDPAQATAGGAVTSAIALALDGQTVQLGQLLAPTGVSEIVVVTSVAPSLPGVQSAQVLDPPGALLPALERQRDLVAVPGGGGAVIFADRLAIPQLAQRATRLNPVATSSSPFAVAAWQPLVDPSARSGQVSTATASVYAGFAPAGDFSIHDSTGSSTSTSAFGWAQSSRVVKGQVTLALSVLPYDALLGAAMVIAWLALALALIGRHRWLDWWGPALRRRMTRTAPPAPTDEEQP